MNADHRLLSGIAGIYIITNTHNEKIYVGSAIDRKLIKDIIGTIKIHNGT
jgi:hypothetical protein